MLRVGHSLGERCIKFWLKAELDASRQQAAAVGVGKKTKAQAKIHTHTHAEQASGSSQAATALSDNIIMYFGVSACVCECGKRCMQATCHADETQKLQQQPRQQQQQ